MRAPRLAALLLSLVFVGAIACLNGCGGSDDAAGAQSKAAHLDQVSPGATPTVRMGWKEDYIPDPASVVAWLVFRGAYYGFAADARSLIDALDTRTLTLYEDTRTSAGPISFTRDFQYLDGNEYSDGTVDVTYSRAALVDGQTYYYRARRVVEPNAGSPPIADTGQTTSEIDVDPQSALSQASAPQGPVTYFQPSTPSRPSDGATAVSTRHIVFQWANPTGPDQFQVRVYDRSSASGQPVLQSPTLSGTGSAGTWTYDTGGSAGALAGSRYYYWVVCSRRGAEATPTCAGEDGWLKGSVRSFLTAYTPPGTP